MLKEKMQNHFKYLSMCSNNNDPSTLKSSILNTNRCISEHNFRVDICSHLPEFDDNSCYMRGLSNINGLYQFRDTVNNRLSHDSTILSKLKVHCSDRETLYLFEKSSYNSKIYDEENKVNSYSLITRLKISSQKAFIDYQSYDRETLSDQKKMLEYHPNLTSISNKEELNQILFNRNFTHDSELKNEEMRINSIYISNSDLRGLYRAQYLSDPAVRLREDLVTAEIRMTERNIDFLNSNIDSFEHVSVEDYSFLDSD